jgi:hypothetical protein
MNNACFSLATIFALSFYAASATALEITLVSAQPDASAATDTATAQQGSQSEIAANSPCHKVEVAVDEGYGVSGHAVREECAPAR